MFPLQREIGFIVVEPRLTPVDLFVAIPAFLAKSPLMRFVDLMAGHTSGRSVAVFLASFVAIRTCDFDVASEKGKLSHAMVKGVWIQSYNIRIAAFVVGMAMLAVDSRDVGDFTVEATLPGDVFIDVLVAKKAQVVLSTLSKAAMTLGTVILEFGVSLNDRPRHHQRFQYGRNGSGRLKHQAGSNTNRNPNSHDRSFCIAKFFPGNRRMPSQYMWTATTCATPVITNSTNRGK